MRLEPSTSIQSDKAVQVRLSCLRMAASPPLVVASVARDDGVEQGVPPFAAHAEHVTNPALEPHPVLLHHPGRPSIVGVARGFNAVHADLEAQLDKQPYGFSHVAAAPAIAPH